MPESWKLGIICPIYKKGDKLECENYRGITLLKAAYKILTGIINDRVKKVTERIIGEYQCGFCPGKSTTDHLFIIRQIMEKNWEHGLDLHMLFIDFKQAFDSVKRRKLPEVMNTTGISQKLVRLIEMTIRGTKAVVKINNRETKTSGCNTGVKQGDGLSATLFIIALHNIIREIDQRGTIFNKLSQVCAYGDDVVLITRTKQKLTQIYEYLDTEARKIGLLVNERKTKYMFMSAVGNTRGLQNLRIRNKEFEGVSEFKYLGNIIENKNRNDICIKERIQARNKAYYANLQTLKSKRISRRSKLQIYKTLIRPIMAHGAETWMLTDTEENALKGRYYKRYMDQ
jgi:sorting nexin-29